MKKNNKNLNLLNSFNNKEDLKEKLNLNYLNLINKTQCNGYFDLPCVLSPFKVNIDYLALYSDKFEYDKTNNTCVCFYEYDKVFDNINGLFNAIYYQNESLLNKYKERFKNVKIFISPDYSMIGDCPNICNIYNLFKARIVSLYLTIVLEKLVIPNISFSTIKDFSFMLDGLQNCNVVAFSTKGSLKNNEQKELLIKAIKFTVDNLKYLKQIVIYDVSSNNEEIFKIFKYALDKNIEILIPNNILKNRNKIKRDILWENI